MAYESYPPEKSTERSPGLEDSRTPDSAPKNAPLAPEEIPGAARAGKRAEGNIDQLDELIREKGELIIAPVRLRILGRLYGLNPTADSKERLRSEIAAVVENNEHWIDPYNIVGKAITEAIEYSDTPPDVDDLIEMIRPSEEILKNKSEWDVKNIESLYSYSRDDAKKLLAKNRIEWTISEVGPELAERELGKAIRDLGERCFHYREVGRFQELIAAQYLENGNIERARALVHSEGYEADRIEGFLRIFKATRDQADIQAARAAKVYDSLYQEAIKWQKIAEAAGGESDVKNANQKLEEMNGNRSYQTRGVFSFYARMHDLPGINGARLEEILREKAKSMPPLDRAKAYLHITGMSKKDEDADVILKELESAAKIPEQDFRVGEGIRSELLESVQSVNLVRDKAEASALLLRDFIEFLGSNPEFATSESQQIASRLLRECETSYPRARENSLARWVFSDGPEGAREQITSLFWNRDDFKTDLAGMKPEDIWRRARARIKNWGRGHDARIDQEALTDIFEVLNKKIPDEQERNNYLSDLTGFAVSYGSDNESDARFILRLIETYKAGDKVPAYDHTLDYLRGQVASYSAATLEADINTEKIKSPYLRGMKIAEVAKRRKELARA